MGDENVKGDNGDTVEKTPGTVDNPQQRAASQISSVVREEPAKSSPADKATGERVAKGGVGPVDRDKLEQATAPAGEMLQQAPKSLISRVAKGLRHFFSTNVHALPENDLNYAYIDLLEVKALVRFATERGIDAETPAIPLLVESLVNLHDPEIDAATRRKLDLEIANQYKQLCAHTYKELGVNGRTIVDSAKRSDAAVGQAGLFLIVFLGLALVPDGASLVMSNADPAFAYLESLKILSPFFWGGVGGSVFLLKTLSEIAGNSRFDTRRYEGIGTRVFLGAIIGFTVVQLFNVSDFLILEIEPGKTFQFGENGLAFLAGLGVKAVYGAFETIINGLHSWITGRSNWGPS